MKTRRLTMAQALVAYLKQQYVERDGKQHRFFEGMLGIFGHGNVAGIGQALQENPDFFYYPIRNEQSAVHLASGFAKASNRLRAFACTSSIGPGATNMITGAALATINRLPVLLLPGDIFATRKVAPVLQQLESPYTQDISVNDCFKPVSRYWDRINRPEQIITALPEAMRVLTSPAECGAVTLSLPQDVQAEAFDYPEEMFARRVWIVRRPEPDALSLQRAIEALKHAERPLLIAGGGVLMSEASEALAAFASQTGIPVCETQAGKGSLAWDHPQNLGAIGATGTLAANRIAAKADVILGVGTRYSDFTTASMTAFQHPGARFINLNVAEFDAFKVSALGLVADARVGLQRMSDALPSYRVEQGYEAEYASLISAWRAEEERLLNVAGDGRPAQSAVIGAIWDVAGDRDMIVSAAGSHPGDLHKLWRARTPNSYHMEYGYSCMGYELPGGLGARIADPTRDVFVWVGDATYLMMPSELVTAAQEGIKIIVILVDNKGFGSIGSLSRSLGLEGFGTTVKKRTESGALDGDNFVVDYAMNARSLGVDAVTVSSIPELKEALLAAKASTRSSVVVIETEGTRGVPGYDSWWDVAVPEVSTMPGVQEARRAYDDARKKERFFFNNSNQ